MGLHGSGFSMVQLVQNLRANPFEFDFERGNQFRGIGEWRSLDLATSRGHPGCAEVQAGAAQRVRLAAKCFTLPCGAGLSQLLNLLRSFLQVAAEDFRE